MAPSYLPLYCDACHEGMYDSPQQQCEKLYCEHRASPPYRAYETCSIDLEVARLAMAYPTLRSSAFRSTPLGQLQPGAPFPPLRVVSATYPTLSRPAVQHRSDD